MRSVRNVVMATAVLSLIAAPVTAQQWKWDWGINGGYSWLTPMLGTDETGLPEDAPSSKVKFANGFLVGSQLTYWPGAKLGLRLNARFGSRDVKFSDMPDGMEDFDPVDDVNLWGGTFDFMFRFKAPAAEYTGTEMLPYLALGVGLKWHNPGFDDFTCNITSDSKAAACGPFVTGGSGPAARGWAITEQKTFAGHIGLGADWRLSRNMALRTELSDQLFKPRVLAATLPPSGNTWTVPLDESEAKLVHELGAQIGLHFLFGVPRPAPVVAVVTPQPQPPPPPPPPTPAPQPDPIREDVVTICVIDPTAPGGIRMQTATRILSGPSMGDTLVMVSGQRVPFRNSIGTVVVASNADWYVRGQPLAITVSGDKIEWVTYGSSQMVESGELTFLGTVNGIPVYADKDDVGDIRDELNDLNRAQRGADLARIMGEHKDLREEISKVRVVYVPLQATGCVFQPLQLQEPVRKGK